MGEYLEKIEKLQKVRQTKSRKWTEEEHESFERIHKKLLIAKELLNLSSEEIEEIQDTISKTI